MNLRDPKRRFLGLGSFGDGLDTSRVRKRPEEKTNPARCNRMSFMLLRNDLAETFRTGTKPSAWVRSGTSAPVVGFVRGEPRAAGFVRSEERRVGKGAGVWVQ